MTHFLTIVKMLLLILNSFKRNILLIFFQTDISQFYQQGINQELGMVEICYGAKY